MYNVIGAVDLLARGTYSRLPSCIHVRYSLVIKCLHYLAPTSVCAPLQDSIIPAEPLSSEAAAAARLTLSRLIRYQLTRSQLPLRMRRFRVCEL